MTDKIRHPYTISGLAPDCRRVLQREYERIQVAMQQPGGESAGYDNTRSQEWNSPEAREERASRAREKRSRAIGAAIAEYRRVAEMWGVDVEVRS